VTATDYRTSGATHEVLGKERRPAFERASRALPTLGPLDGLGPTSAQRGALAVAHARLEARALAPQRLDLVLAAPQAYRQPGEVGGAKRGGLGDLGAHHGDADEVGLDLHEGVVARGAPVDAQLVKDQAAV